MVEYTIDDIRGPTVAREMAQLKEFVLAKFNGAIADAEAAAAQAATDAANAVLSSIDSRVGALEGDMTTAQGDIVANANAILALDGAAVKLAGAQTITGAKTFSVSPSVPAPVNAADAANKKYVDDSLDNYAPMVRTTDNQTIAGNKTFSNAISGTISLMHNKNINNISVKVGVASGTGAYKYGSAFYIVIVRNTPYFVTMSSGSGALKHDTINVLNLATGSVVNPSDLEWKMGYYIDTDSMIFVTITGPAANRISWVHFMGGTQGGSSGLIVKPTTNDTIPTSDVITFW